MSCGSRLRMNAVLQTSARNLALAAHVHFFWSSRQLKALLLRRSSWKRVFDSFGNLSDWAREFRPPRSFQVAGSDVQIVARNAADIMLLAVPPGNISQTEPLQRSTVGWNLMLVQAALLSIVALAMAEPVRTVFFPAMRHDGEIVEVANGVMNLNTLEHTI